MAASGRCRLGSGVVWNTRARALRARTPRSRIALALVVVLGLVPVTGRGQSPLSEALADDLARAREAWPGLVQLDERAAGPVVMGAAEAPLAALLAELRAGRFPPGTRSALRVLFSGLASQTGMVAVRGRQLMQDAAGAAASSGAGPALRGLAALLAEVMEDPASAYSLLAQELLSEKLRCGAAARSDDELVRQIAERVNPDRAFPLAGTDGTVADRYGLHVGADLYSVIARGRDVVAVGRFGTLAVSRDGGASWYYPETGTDEPLHAAAFVPGSDELWVAGRSGVVLRSRDAGYSVERVAAPFDRHLFGIAARAAGDVLVVGDFGLQLVHERGHWRCVPRDGDVVLGRIVPAAGDAVMIGEFGTIERLPGGRLPGRRAEITGVPDDVWPFDAWFDATGRTGLVVGLGGMVLRSEDGGAHWAPVRSGLSADLFGVGGYGTRVVVVGETGTIAVSDDLGRHFEPRPTPGPTEALHDVAFGDADTAFAVGPRGTILALRDGARRIEWLRGPGAPHGERAP
jgi:photosystem II stability/assembly factor-like uncharacterized protein